jgi:NAD(P)-dependent dehydrogenase (short-subunit alcohol dehydrogenase family)
MNVEGKVVLITGADGALGRAVTRAFAGRGANLALTDYRAEGLRESFADLDDALLVGGIDVTDPAAVERLVEAVVERWGRIDVLVNIVGTWRGGQPVHETEIETWDFLMNLNARSAFLVSRAVVPHMIEAGTGKVVSVAAKTGLEGRANVAAYSASKSAVIRLTEAMSDELKDDGINVNCVLPSIIDTPPNREAMPKADYARWVAPEALADVIVFLSSDAARAIHGAAIPVYGRV